MYSQAHADRAVAFFEGLKHTKGKFHGEPFKLLPWEEKIIREVYGTLKETEVDWLDNHKIDATIHISYLGRFFLHNDKDFQRKAYIKPDADLVAKWARWLEQYPRPWRGIAWKGGVPQTQTTIRSIDLPDMAPLIAGTVIDLSYHDSSREVAEWNIANKTQIIRPPIDTRNYDDTVALVAALDEVVTVTTTVAHVCGSMGKRAHVLVPAVALVSDLFSRVAQEIRSRSADSAWRSARERTVRWRWRFRCLACCASPRSPAARPRAWP